MKPDKIVVTNRAALEGKYGPGAGQVLRAVDRLVAADAQRGIATAVVGLDRREDLAPFGATPVSDARDEEGAKRAIDAIDEAIRPHYYLLLGGPDIVPMQQLENPTGLVTKMARSGDADMNVPSDMPYACDAPYSSHRDPADFLYPSRAVGRLPDLLWAKRPTYLVELLRLAAAARPLPRQAYRDWFALSAARWNGSTSKTVKKLFGGTSRLVLSPPAEDSWPASLLKPRVHLINCHGGNMDDGFNGQDVDDEDGNPGEQSLAITARSLRGRVTPGTVVAAECCYGAQLFDSTNVTNPLVQRDFAEVQWPTRGRAGIALEYLRQGAHGFFGSTTVAYGPTDTVAHADVICRVFLQKVLEGCSLGRAALEARIAYARTVKWASPVMWKTLAQFHLLGDPSVHPVAGGRAERHRAITAEAVREQERARRRRRRERQHQEAKALEMAREVYQLDELVPPQRMEEFFALADRFGVRNKFVRAFTLLAGRAKVAQGDPSLAALRQSNQVLMLTDVYQEERRRLRGREPFPRFAVAVAHFRNGTLVGKEKLESR
ncbi:MAG: hypothetical protein KIS74_11160 [Burkholderiales bacterium]|nr:hypothetical protein [Burkholderiales bacterium]